MNSKTLFICWQFCACACVWSRSESERMDVFSWGCLYYIKVCILVFSLPSKYLSLCGLYFLFFFRDRCWEYTIWTERMVVSESVSVVCIFRSGLNLLFCCLFGRVCKKYFWILVCQSVCVINQTILASGHVQCFLVSVQRAKSCIYDCSCLLLLLISLLRCQNLYQGIVYLNRI